MVTISQVTQAEYTAFVEWAAKSGWLHLKTEKIGPGSPTYEVWFAPNGETYKMRIA